ncbi:HTH domain-containing protein, partial [Klebsiella pneumoniae]
MKKERKLLGEERRALILQWLKENHRPMTGTELANKTNVSRQVIVQDISLLKARNEPIIATSQGYLYLSPSSTHMYT